MTAKRDESRDVFVVAKFGQPLRVYPGDTQIIDSPDGAEECAHYVLGSQYAVLEKERDELRERLNERSRLAVEVFHEEDKDGPHVLAEAYLEYRCVKCGETILREDGEMLDGMSDEINGYSFTCKCGAEYVGFTDDAAKLASIQEAQTGDEGAE